jgi:protein-disulfide isomerase
MKKSEFLMVVGAIFFLVSGFFVGKNFFEKYESQKMLEAVTKDSKKLLRDFSPRLGSSRPKVHVVEFLDPECESCREFYPVMKTLMSEFSSEVQLVIRYAPFHPNSRLAIKILEASRKQGRYWEALETLFKYQPQWGSHHHPQPELLWTYLPEAGVDGEKIRTDIMDGEIEKNLEQDISDAQALMVRATPTVFVNGRRLEVLGAQTIRELIQEELQKISLK